MRLHSPYFLRLSLLLPPPAIGLMVWARAWRKRHASKRGPVRSRPGGSHDDSGVLPEHAAAGPPRAGRIRQRGEGMVIQLARDGRRVLWLAHESAPKNVTAIDVTDPRKPAIILQTNLPHAEMRSNSLDLAGDLLVVAYQTARVGMTPAGFEIFDVRDPGRPSRSRSSTPRDHSRAASITCGPSTAPTFIWRPAPLTSRRESEGRSVLRIVDVRDPTHPVEVGRWWLPGTREGDAEAPPVRHAGSTAAFAPTTRTSIPSGPTARGSATSTVAPSSSTSPTWRGLGW